MPTELSNGNSHTSLGWAATVIARAGHGTAKASAATATVSVIIPIWNVEPWLRACLDSVVGQTIWADRIELILVDDGSTDASGAIADEYASRHPQVTVIHETNSGGPGHPRNVGLDRASGTFVFFLDADDYLGPEALERLTAMAMRHGSDIVIGKVVPVDARPHSSEDALFARNVAHAEIEFVYRSSSVLKLFRRSLFVRTGVRFDDTCQGGEDGDVMARLYPQANLISVLADYDCYYLRGRPGSQTTRSDRTDDLTAYIERIERERFRPVAASRAAGPRRDLLMIKHVRVLVRLFGRRWVRLEPEERRRVFDTGAAVLRRWDTPLIDGALPPWAAIRVHCLVHGRLAELVDIVAIAPQAVYDDPIVEGGRLYARWPHFRDGSGIPDRCFDITEDVAIVQQTDVMELVGGRLHLAGHAYLRLVGGTTTLRLRRWPQGPTFTARPSVVATPTLRDRVRWYREAGFDATIDLAHVVRGGPLPPGIWTIGLVAGNQCVRRAAPVRVTPGAAASGRASRPRPDGGDRALYVAPDGAVRLRIGQPRRAVRWLEQVEGVGARERRWANAFMSGTRPGRLVRMGVDHLTPRVAAGAVRDWARAEISSARAPWRRAHRTPGR